MTNNYGPSFWRGRQSPLRISHIKHICRDKLEDAGAHKNLKNGFQVKIIFIIDAALGVIFFPLLTRGWSVPLHVWHRYNRFYYLTMGIEEEQIASAKEPRQ